MGLSSSLLSNLPMTQPTLLEAGRVDRGRNRRRRAMQTCRSRWKPTATSAPQHRRSSSATLAGSRNTRSPSVCHSQQLAGCGLPNASYGLRARHLAMQFGRHGCALGRPSHDWPRGVSFVTYCGVHGLTHRLNHPNHLLSHGDAPSFLHDCRCLGCDPSVTSTYARAPELSPMTRFALAGSPRLYGHGWASGG